MKGTRRTDAASFHGLGTLARFVWRLDRVRLAVWLASITAVTVVVAAAFPGLYPTRLERQILAETMRNPAMTAMVGPGYGLDNYTDGAMMAHQMLLFTAVTVAIMSILLVTRSTRGDEEAGRLEMIRSLPVGRLTAPAATMVVLGLANVALSVLVGVGLAALGVESMDGHGSVLYGAVLGVTGVFFAALTLLCAQLTETSRGTLGYAFGFLGAAYLIRAVGDTGTEWLSLISPLGLILRTQVYVNNVWWPIPVMLAAAAVVAGAALYLNSIRDVGASFVPTRPGPRHASRGLLNPLGVFLGSGARVLPPLGLAIRLQRTSLIGWAVGMFVIGASYGSVFADLESFFESTEIIRQLLLQQAGVSLTDQFAALVTVVMAMIAAIPAMMMVLKLKGEEEAGRTEPVLAGAVSRSALIGSYIVLGVVAAVVMPVLAAVGLGVAADAVTDGPVATGAYVRAALNHVPAILVMVGLAGAAVGFAPRLASVAWVYLGFSFFVVYIGGLLQLPAWVQKVSPFGHVPQMPVEAFQPAPAVILSLFAVALLAAGVSGYRRRDVRG